MTWQDWPALVLGGSGLLSSLVAIAAILIQERSARAARKELLAAEQQRLDQQLAGERSRLERRLEFEQQSQARVQAIGLLDEHIEPIAKYCAAMTAVTDACLSGCGRRKLLELYRSTIHLYGEAGLATILLGDDALREALRQSHACIQRLVGLPDDERRLGDTEFREKAWAAFEPLAEAKSLLASLRLSIIKDPFAWAERVHSSVDEGQPPE